jgi:hypothetical protein
MQQPDFVTGYLPFWIMNYALAAVVWSCVGRFLLSFFMPAIQPSNYIWRGFVWITEWSVVASRWITPSPVPGLLLPLVAAFWLFHLRVILFLLFWRFGMTPSIPAAVG